MGEGVGYMAGRMWQTSTCGGSYSLIDGIFMGLIYPQK